MLKYSVILGNCYFRECRAMFGQILNKRISNLIINQILRGILWRTFTLITKKRRIIKMEAY